MRDFIEMGGYGLYVWPAYIVSFAVLAALSALIWRRGKSLGAKLKREQARRGENAAKEPA